MYAIDGSSLMEIYRILVNVAFNDCGTIGVEIRMDKLIEMSNLFLIVLN